MGEFLSNYGFFILIALFMVGCHLFHGHGGHGGGEEKDNDRETRRKGERQSGGGGHQH